MRRMLCLMLSLFLLFSVVSGLADEPNPIEIIPWDELPPSNPDQHHYLLLCLDHWDIKDRPDGIDPPTQSNGNRRDLYGNTDGIVVLTLDTRAKRIMLTSIVRDALILKPNSTETSQKIGRVNYVYNDYGPEALCRVLSEHLGFRIEKYIMFTFGQIRDIIDLPALGGVDVELTRPEIQALNGWSVSRGGAVSQDGRYDIHSQRNSPPGVYHLDGRSAVIYMRIRKFGGGGDFTRTQRVRNVLSVLADKCRNFTLEEANHLANSIGEHNNRTNLSLQEMLEAAGYAFRLKNCTIEELAISREVAHGIDYGGATQEVDWAAFRDKVQYFQQNSFLVIDDEDE